jgi:signal transduction histidine kinase
MTARHRASSAVALNAEIALLKREREELLKQRTATSEVLGIISQTKFELQPILRNVVGTAARLCRATMGSIFELDNGVYRFAVGFNLDPTYVQRQRLISPGLGTVVGRTAMSRQVAQIDDVLADPLYEEKEDAKIGGVRSLLGVPLMREGEPIGVIVMGRPRVEPFGEREIELVSTFADQAVIAIEAREREREVADQARSAEQALDLLASVSRTASTAVDVRTLAFDCLVQFGRSGGWQFGQLWYPEPTIDVIKCSSDSYFGGSEFAEFHSSSMCLGLRKGEDIPGRVWNNRAPVWIADLNGQHDFPRLQAARSMSLKSALAFPVTINEDVMVIFELYSCKTIPPNHTVMDAVVKVGRLLGDILVRRRSELALQTAYSELARISQFSAMGVMTASIGHEIRQPLAAMVASANAALRWFSSAKPDVDEIREALESIVKDGRRTSDILETIRGMFKNDNQEVAPVDVNELIREVLALVHLNVHKQGVLIQTELNNKLPHVFGNRIQLQQVVLNLTINAMEAMSTIADRERILRVKSAIHEPGSILIMMEDSGSGIDPKNVERIFDALFTTKSQGMGMGLSICRSIIEAHRGRLWASAGVIHGSVFHVILPTTEVDAEGPATLTDAEQRGEFG